MSLSGASVAYYPNFIDFSESKRLTKQLYQEIAWRQDKIAMFGKMVDIPRLQAWFGDNNASYTYSKLTLFPLNWTRHLLEFKQQVSEFCQQEFNAMLANCYRDHRDSVSWHSDDEPELGEQPIIASLSFGCQRMFHLKHKGSGESVKLPLQSGSLLVMSGDTQKNWQHAIHKSRVEQSMRINLTFRNIQ
ncbi:alpha-ketoglutarate-dependent dioxygenase AlkB family protein [Thalassotalea castellviae]|uniref:Alpha-ketoglutarate-dependent dioxygenase AlkB n=1 Tax=Thalassotalea castellviae TaxID=3075612 RepID=A0ABU3A0F7_9GAMM|nr:alpha-ketoglutarate-dependent dioxygenase AlkB [Thalassotalea sp. W431]MDT0603668.1 alpha-ketoglutarate-dependent dioxygenase AlkB [Thalassotalea sp. W431]